MNCINFRKRSKKGKIYFYCINKKQKITFDNCNDCEFKEYKQYKPLKSRSNKLARNENKRFSIIYSDLSKCCECGSKIDIEKNEIFEDYNRQISIRLGMVCPLCHECHKRFHSDRAFNLKYKAMFQKEYMKTHTLDGFISIFGKNYIYIQKKK